MKYVPSIEKHGAFLLLFLFSLLHCLHNIFTGWGRLLTLCMPLADLPGSAVCALDAHKR